LATNGTCSGAITSVTTANPVLQAFFAQPLEAVGGGARFKGTPPQQVGARFFHHVSRFDDLLAAFHRTGAGHDDDLLAPDAVPVESKDGILRLEIAAGQLEGPQDGHNALHAAHSPQAILVQRALVADHADDGPLFPLGQMGPKAQALHALHNPLDLLLAGSHFHDDNHG
jgi:hypothetical protein